MSEYACNTRRPPVDPGVHREIRLRRHGLRGPTARLIGELAFGPARDAIVVVAITDAGTLAEGVRQ